MHAPTSPRRWGLRRRRYRERTREPTPSSTHHEHIHTHIKFALDVRLPVALVPRLGNFCAMGERVPPLGRSTPLRAHSCGSGPCRHIQGFVLGWKRTEDDAGKEMRVPYSCQVYPPPVVVDASKLPPLEDGQGDAMKKIMGSTTIPQAQKMQYLNAWQTAKRTGVMPSAGSDAITLDMTLKDILFLMEKKADKAMQDVGVAGGAWSGGIWAIGIRLVLGRRTWATRS